MNYIRKDVNMDKELLTAKEAMKTVTEYLAEHDDEPIKPSEIIKAIEECESHLPNFLKSYYSGASFFDILRRVKDALMFVCQDLTSRDKTPSEDDFKKSFELHDITMKIFEVRDKHWGEQGNI